MFIEKVHQHKADFHGDVRTLITGISFQCPEDWESILESLDSQSDLTLRKEPDNPHDKYAIAAYFGDRRIGYVSKDDNCTIYMFLGNEPIRCEVIEKYNASFKVSFEHPKKAYEKIRPVQIFQLQSDCEYEGYNKSIPSYEIPILEIGNDRYDWYDDTIVIPNMEKWIVDFNRKFVSNKIELVCRQASDGKFYYYLPYLNWDIAEVQSQEICRELERLGIGIGLVDVATFTYQNTIVVDLKVGLCKDWSGISAMSYFTMKREKGNFNFIYKMSKKTKTKNEVSISEEQFSNFINENMGIEVLNVPNSSWKYDYTDFLGDALELFETYIYKKRVLKNPLCKEIIANAVKGERINFCVNMDFKISKKEILDLIYKYKKLFYPDYSLAKCEKEYGNKRSSFLIKGISPLLSVDPPVMGNPYSMTFYTTFCNKAYIDMQKAKGKIVTLKK